MSPAVSEGACFQLLQKIDAFIATHGSNGHVVGDSTTIADFFLFVMVRSS